MPMPMTSVSMCPASDNRASEPVAIAPTTSTTMNTASTRNAAVNLPRWRLPADSPCEWPWS